MDSPALPWPPSHWTDPPAQLSPERDYAHLFALALDLPLERLEQLSQLLSADEQARAKRFLPSAARRRFTAAHGQLREILSAYLGCAPGNLRFHQNAYGKPALEKGPHFNLTHTDDAGLLGVSFEHVLGVDLEAVTRSVDFTNIARRFFAPAEVQALLALPAEQQPQAFFNGWTRKEAYLKARGEGLSIPLDSFVVSLAPGEPAVIQGVEPDWQIFALDVGPAYAAALVSAGELNGLRCWNWEEKRRG